MPNISEIVTYGAKLLRSRGIPDATREVQSLLSLAIKKDRIFFIAHPDYELTIEENERFSTFLNRRSKREPFQYIRGFQEFWGLDFVVNPNVLIPRPETELIVEHGIAVLQEIKNPEICEIGTGSGCIIISLLSELKTAWATAVDISEKALATARENAGIHHAGNRLNLIISDIYKNIPPTAFDLIVTNPPYISRHEMAELQAEVKDFEPHTALTDGKNGLSIVEKIIGQTPTYLKSGGFLLMEIGINQAENVKKLFAGFLWSNIEIVPDLQGIPRMVKAQLR